MRFSILVASCFALTAASQQCGPSNKNTICAPNNCCSGAGWCDTDAAHCDPASCLPAFSGEGSTCKTTTGTKNPPTTTSSLQCGPNNGNRICAAKNCCSGAGWCDTDAAHCDPATCLPAFSGEGSTCKAKTTSGTKNPTTTPSSTAKPYESSIPVIDVCGHAEGGVSCPGAGTNGYYYRCCSSGGHCGPKNNIQDQSLYCGASAGCQDGFGDCATNKKAPALPSGPAKISQTGQTCGPIVNAKCASGLCCSGSNFCGTGAEFCGAANWCQPKWGVCS